MSADTVTTEVTERDERARVRGLIESAVEDFTARFPLVDFWLYRGSAGQVVLSGLVVEKQNRKRGHGSAFMAALVAWADAQGLTVALTPVVDLGATSRARLARFYRRFGFVNNFTGRNSDYSIGESMFRRPQATGGK